MSSKISYDEAHDDLTQIAHDALAIASAEAPKGTTAVCFVMNGNRVGVGMHGYEEEGAVSAAVTDVILCLQGTLKAAGINLSIMTEDGVIVG